MASQKINNMKHELKKMDEYAITKAIKNLKCKKNNIYNIQGGPKKVNHYNSL